MKLKCLRMRNFRCFQKETSIDFEDITALLGKNDSGKSSILEALDLFLNDGNPDKDDASKNGDAKDLSIICEFTDLPDSVVIDEDSPTSLSAEYLLNANGNLEIHKTYSGHLQAPRCTSIAAIANHPNTDDIRDLLQLKNPDLKKRAKELSVSLTDVDTKVNAKIRAAIRNHVGNLNIVSRSVELNDDNGKKIWEGLKNYLPAFALFKSDRSGTDQDAEAQDPLKAAVKEAIKSKEAELNAITEYVRTEVDKIAHSTLDKLHEMDPSLASQLNPTFAAQKWESLFKTSISCEDNIPINKRGSGVRRLILINFFRAKAEQLAKTENRTSIIYAIEEPETGQHPHNQRLLLRALVDLSSDSQVIITTHTPTLARALPETSLRYIHVPDDKSRDLKTAGPETNEMIANSLGILPDDGVRLFIAVEGPNDINFLQKMAWVLRNDNQDIPDLEKLELDGEIIFLPGVGSNLAYWSKRLQPLNRYEFHLYDRDVPPPEPAKHHDYIEQISLRQNCRARSTLKREIENYLHKDAIVAAYRRNGFDLEIPANYEAFDDVPRLVAQLVHDASDSTIPWEELELRRQEDKAKHAKKMLCSVAVLYMTSAMLNEVDPEGDVISWFTDIRELLH